MKDVGYLAKGASVLHRTLSGGRPSATGTFLKTLADGTDVVKGAGGALNLATGNSKSRQKDFADTLSGNAAMDSLISGSSSRPRPSTTDDLFTTAKDVGYLAKGASVLHRRLSSGRPSATGRFLKTLADGTDVVKGAGGALNLASGDSRSRQKDFADALKGNAAMDSLAKGFRSPKDARRPRRPDERKLAPAHAHPRPSPRQWEASAARARVGEQYGGYGQRDGQGPTLPRGGDTWDSHRGYGATYGPSLTGDRGMGPGHRSGLRRTRSR